MSQAQDWAVSTSPAITDKILGATLQENWGLRGALHRLYAERDLNACLHTPGGTRYLVKVSHPDANLAQLDLQDRAIRHVEEHAPALPVPRLIGSRSGALRVTAASGDQQFQVRVYSWLAGDPLELNDAPLAAASATGRALAGLGQALRDCSGTGAPIDFPWDLQRLQNLAPLHRALRAGQGRELARQVLDHHAQFLSPALSALPRQVIHNDLNPDNILFEEAPELRISGLIDFGDLVVAPLVCDLAVASAYLVNPEDSGPFTRVIEATRAYLELQPLSHAQLSLLPDLIACRQVTTLLIQGYRLARGQDSDGSLATVCRNAEQRLIASFSDAGKNFRAWLETRQRHH